MAKEKKEQEVKEVKDKVNSDILNSTEDSENELQSAEDNKKLNDVLTGRQEIYITGYGAIIFDMPHVELALEGDNTAAKFKSKHLMSGDYLTDAQLKAIYNNPTIVKVSGKELTLGTGEWTEKDEREMDDLPANIQNNWDMFLSYREEYQTLKQEILAVPKIAKNKAKIKELTTRQDNAQKRTLDQHQIILSLKGKLIGLQATRVRLFSDSLEEQAFFEKIKLYAPSCIKIEKDGVVEPLWKSTQDMLNDKFTATRIITLFNLFVRGLDVRFFGDAPEEETSS